MFLYRKIGLIINIKCGLFFKFDLFMFENSLSLQKNSNMKFRIDIQESVNEGKFPKILETISPIFTKISNVSFKESSLSKKKNREIELEKNNDESIFFSI